MLHSLFACAEVWILADSMGFGVCSLDDCAGVAGCKEPVRFLGRRWGRFCECKYESTLGELVALTSMTVGLATPCRPHRRRAGEAGLAMLQTV